jgi:hypothetical protein
MRIPRWWAVACIGVMLALGSVALNAGARDFVRGYSSAEASALSAYDVSALSAEQRGAIYFTLSGFGGLDTDAMNTHATPWHLTGAALVLMEADATGAPINAETLRRIMQRFGFLYPEHVANWPQSLAAPRFEDAPLGLAIGVARRGVPPLEVTIANLGCAACHAGAGYDSAGAPTPDVVWLGAPNTAINLEAYVQAIYRAYSTYRADEARLMQAVVTVFPDTSALELQTLKQFVWPRVRARLAQIARGGAGPLPFLNGYPGLTNGVAALKMQFQVLDDRAYERERGFAAIPDLADRALRSNLL